MGRYIYEEEIAKALTRGHCATCGAPADKDSNCTDCDCARPLWEAPSVIDQAKAIKALFEGGNQAALFVRLRFEARKGGMRSSCPNGDGATHILVEVRNGAFRNETVFTIADKFQAECMERALHVMYEHGMRAGRAEVQAFIEGKR